ncbi:MAG: hypothetical protein KJ955_01700 [Nanoarchaeota archaeon]|nr:hypothetical protein [Nanoarchaeota archaeon]
MNKFLIAGFSMLLPSVHPIHDTQPAYEHEPRCYYAEPSPHLEEITSDNFDEKVLQNNLPAIVEFYAPWCTSCLEMKGVFEDACGSLEGRAYCGAYDADRIDISTDPIMQEYDIDGVPEFLFFCRGWEISKLRISSDTDAFLLKWRIQQLIYLCA